MKRFMIYFLLLILMSVGVIVSGVYMTILSKKDPSKQTAEELVETHIKTNKTIKLLGPVFIGVGAVMFVGTVLALMKRGHYPSHDRRRHCESHANNFGFKFY